MDLNELISEHPKVAITITGEDLAEFARTIADEAAQAVLQKKDERLYTRAQLIEKFDTCGASLWRWEKAKLINGRRVGNRVYYPESEVQKLLEQKSK